MSWKLIYPVFCLGAKETGKYQILTYVSLSSPGGRLQNKINVQIKFPIRDRYELIKCPCSKVAGIELNTCLSNLKIKLQAAAQRTTANFFLTIRENFHMKTLIIWHDQREVVRMISRIGKSVLLCSNNDAAQPQLQDDRYELPKIRLT